jgi:hypothetical protein
MSHYTAEKDNNRSNWRDKRIVDQMVGNMKDLDATMTYIFMSP